MNKNLDKAIKVVRSGGIVIFPTDTAFGIGCRIDDAKAVKKLFKLRKRPNEKAVPILVSSLKMAKQYAEFSSQAEKLVKKNWPGGLTTVLPARNATHSVAGGHSIVAKVPSVVRGGGATIGVRMPNHSSTLKLIRKVGVPIVGCSANFAGKLTPYKMSDLDPELVKLVDFVMPGRCSVKKASTVVDLSSGRIKVIREGAVEI